MEIVTMKDIELSIEKSNINDLPLNYHKILNCYYDNDLDNK